MASLDRRGYIKRSITKADLTFLEELQHELDTQPALATADPRFWVIRDYEYREASRSDEIDTVELFEHGNGETMSLREAATKSYEDVSEFMTVDEKNEWLDDNWLFMDDDGLVNANKSTLETFTYQQVIDDYADANGITCVYLTKDWHIVPDTLFLTLREAEEHLKANYYHYTAEAHTYGMHGWRSPELAQLIKLLHEVDFVELAELVSKEGLE